MSDAPRLSLVHESGPSANALTAEPGQCVDFGRDDACTMRLAHDGV